MNRIDSGTSGRFKKSQKGVRAFLGSNDPSFPKVVYILKTRKFPIGKNQHNGDFALHEFHFERENNIEVKEDLQVEFPNVLVQIMDDAWQFMQESSSGASTCVGNLSEYHAWHQAMFQTYVRDTFQYRPADSIVAERHYEWIAATVLPRKPLQRNFERQSTPSEFFEEDVTSRDIRIDGAVTGAPVDLNFASRIDVPSPSFSVNVKPEKDVSVLAPVHNCLPVVTSAFCGSDNANELEQKYCSVEKQIVLADTHPILKQKPPANGRMSVSAKLKAFEWEKLVHYDDEDVGEESGTLGNEGGGERAEEETTMPHSSNRLAISDSPPLMQHQPDGMLIRNNPAVRTCMPISSSRGIIAEPTLLMAVKENAPHGRQSKQCLRAEASDADSVCYFDLQMSFAEEEEESPRGALPETPVISPASVETLLAFHTYPRLHATERTNVEE